MTDKNFTPEEVRENKIYREGFDEAIRLMLLIMDEYEGEYNTADSLMIVLRGRAEKLLEGGAE